MKINYNKILNENMINVFKDVLTHIKKNGLQENHHLYITFDTNNSKINMPKWLKEKHIDQMTIVLQYEYWNFKVYKNSFNIGLSFNDIKTDLEIPFSSIISFADPYANFGLKLNNKTDNQDNNVSKKQINKRLKKGNKKDNVIDFKKFKKDIHNQ
tara:strand:- start:519 stop:983 length:465 start_codon:yes stop_codon:yes gene_type:complete